MICMGKGVKPGVCGRGRAARTPQPFPLHSLSPPQPFPLHSLSPFTAVHIIQRPPPFPFDRVPRCKAAAAPQAAPRRPPSPWLTRAAAPPPSASRMVMRAVPARGRRSSSLGLCGKGAARLPALHALMWRSCLGVWLRPKIMVGAWECTR